MFEYFIWGVSFLFLFIGFFWLNVLYLKQPDFKKLTSFPKITLLVPAFNEQRSISTALKSLLSLDYPQDKIQIIVVNDGSTDSTSSIARSFGSVMVIDKENSGKAAALNTGLEHAKGEFVGCVDADTTVEPSSLKNMIPLFEPHIGAVISTIKINNPGNIWQKIQRIEYIISTFVRKLMSKIETLHITPGALSLYRTHLLKELGGFDEDNITEDFEIAMRLNYNNYKVRIATDSVTFTRPPQTFMQLWNQRVRWFRGFIFNSAKYRKMFMNKRFGWMGTFQYPLNLVSFCTIILMFVLLSYELLTKLYKFVFKVVVLRLDYLSLVEFPSLKDMFVGMNIKITFPVAVSFILSLYLYHKAHKTINEKWKYPFSLIAYLTFYPFIRSLHWIAAVVKESLRTKRKW